MNVSGHFDASRDVRRGRRSSVTTPWRLFVFLLVPLFLLPAVGAAAGDDVPKEVEQRLIAADMLSRCEGFAGSYTLTTDTVTRKPNGKRREETTFVIDVSRSPEGVTARRLQRMIEDGRDVRERRRKRIEKELTAELDRAEDKDTDGIVNPFGETADRYSFGEPENRGNEVLLAFEPKAEFREDREMVRGTLCWHRESLDPLWLEMTSVTTPRLLRKLNVRLEYAREGDTVYVSRFATDGLVKILFISREFETDTRTSAIVSEPPDRPE